MFLHCEETWQLKKLTIWFFSVLIKKNKNQWSLKINISDFFPLLLLLWFLQQYKALWQKYSLTISGFHKMIFFFLGAFMKKDISLRMILSLGNNRHYFYVWKYISKVLIIYKLNEKKKKQAEFLWPPQWQIPSIQKEYYCA